MTTQNFVTLPREVVEQMLDYLEDGVTTKVEQTLRTALTKEQVQPAVNTTGAHATHCYQGEYAHSCKYGNDHCPMQHEQVQPVQGELAARSEIAKRLRSIATEFHDGAGDEIIVLNEAAALLQSNAERVRRETIEMCAIRCEQQVDEERVVGFEVDRIFSTAHKIRSLK